jgi:hypothetical protein
VVGLASPFERWEATQPVTNNYQLSSTSSTLDELFAFVKETFPSVCILTIEGGNCKKPPMIQHFRDHETCKLPELPGVRALILKGTWNMIREESDFSIIHTALPNLKDWQCMYSNPKTKAYMTMNKIIISFPPNLRHLHLCMEGFHSKKWLASGKVNDLRLRHHLCQSLGHILPQLEALTFSGRTCSVLFSSGIEACRSMSIDRPRLRSVDLVLRNCCRDLKTVWGDGTGVYNWGFIQAFEALVISATKSLRYFTELTNMRIRFVDLDSPHAFMNPYFHLKGDECLGIWSDAILENLTIGRPKARFPFNECFVGTRDKPAGYAGRRPNHIKVSVYAGFGDGM